MKKPRDHAGEIMMEGDLRDQIDKFIYSIEEGPERQKAVERLIKYIDGIL